MFATVNMCVHPKTSQCTWLRACGGTSPRLPCGMRPWPLDSHCRLLSGRGDGQISSCDSRHTTGAPRAVAGLWWWWCRCDAKPMPSKCQPDANQMPTRCQPDVNQMPRGVRSNAMQDANKMPHRGYVAHTCMPEGRLGYSIPSGTSWRSEGHDTCLV